MTFKEDLLDVESEALVFQKAISIEQPEHFRVVLSILAF